jgi:hypothetical protein
MGWPTLSHSCQRGLPPRRPPIHGIWRCRVLERRLKPVLHKAKSREYHNFKPFVPNETPFDTFVVTMDEDENSDHHLQIRGLVRMDEDANPDHFLHIRGLDYMPMNWLNQMNLNFLVFNFLEREYTSSFAPVYLETWIQVFHKLQHDIFADDYPMVFENDQPAQHYHYRMDFEAEDNVNPFNNYLYIWFYAVLYRIETHF